MTCQCLCLRRRSRFTRGAGPFAFFFFKFRSPFRFSSNYRNFDPRAQVATLRLTVQIIIADADWVMRPDPVIELWSDTLALTPSLTIVRVGGHFPGSSVACWTDGAGDERRPADRGHHLPQPGPPHRRFPAQLSQPPSAVGRGGAAHGCHTGPAALRPDLRPLHEMPSTPTATAWSSDRRNATPDGSAATTTT